MLAVLLALAAAAGYGGSDYAAGLAARRASVVRVTVAAEVTSAALLLCVAPFLSRQAPSLTSVLWGAGAGASGVAGALALYLGFRHADFSVASSVSAVGAAAFSVLAGLALGEHPGVLSLAGIMFALPAIVAVSAPARQPAPDPAAPGQPAEAPSEAAAPGQPAGAPSEAAAPGQPAGASSEAAAPGQHGQGPMTQERGLEPSGGAGGPLPRASTGHHAAGVGLGLAAGAGFGLFFTGLNEAGSASDLWPVVIAQAAATVTVLCVAAATRDLRPPPAGARRLSVLTGAIGATGTAMFFLATHHGLLAVTAVITSLYPAGTILLARVMSGERLTGLRIAGLSMAAASVALIAAGGAG
jgi:drug/metabolite transporter (DMT)-like permease